MAKGGLPGYPSGKAIRNQASALARASVPTRRSISQPFNQGIGDTAAFTTALMHLLGQSNPGAGYDAAIAQQQGVGQAAAARLAALGGQYGAGSAAAVGGLGDSGLTSLIARGAAAKSYGAGLPAVAGARGQLFQQGLIHDRQTALQNRGDQLRSAFTQALNTVQQQALARSTALASIQQNNRAFRESKRQFNVGQAFNQQQAQQQQTNWAYEHSPQWLAMQAQISAAASGNSGAAGPLSQWTPSQIVQFQKSGSSYADSAVLSGTPINQTIRNMIRQQGIPRQIAVAEAADVYRQVTKPIHDDPAFHKADGTFNTLKWNTANRYYKTVTNSFKSWNQQRAWLKWTQKWHHPAGANGPGR